MPPNSGHLSEKVEARAEGTVWGTRRLVRRPVWGARRPVQMPSGGRRSVQTRLGDRPETVMCKIWAVLCARAFPAQAGSRLRRPPLGGGTRPAQKFQIRFQLFMIF